MLKTALKPRWIAALVLALAVSWVFVLLSQWQFSASQSEAPPPPSATETVHPLTAVFKPGTPMMATTADQMVSFSGRFVPDKQVLVKNRLHEGRQGYWVVSAFAVDGVKSAAGEQVMIPVVRGWVAAPGDAAPAPAGRADVVGRLLPTEGPEPELSVPGQVPTLSVAELINVWDMPGYSGFVAGIKLGIDGADPASQPAGTGMAAVAVGPQPQQTPVNWLNIFYAVEWIVFAGFAVFLWWRLVADDYRRQQEALEDAALATLAQGQDTAPATDDNQTTTS
ncbi:SURF1 family protein [Arthrobacter sp. I2-34]|uniref:SURF1-like protein n=1 Tax=Arthrobacter hankyongi TaxID=2904801 RepID=A0ABS9L585_9MICC|nr:SURF1 family cytochrome oxidase biogenesis protein [Arthrobacter hankyongi]MCG2621733.1 SURF1 family protein [Arthrobacter hankyongi]